MQRSLTLGFAGTPQFAVPALDALVRSRHRVTAVFTQPDRPAGRGQLMHMSPVKHRAAEWGIPVHQPHGFKTAEALDVLYAANLDALIVAAYGLILPVAALGAPTLGCFNIHASLLPRWRGAAPIQRALLAGDAQTGITIMRMEAGLDTGPMLAVRAIDIAARDTAGTVHDRLAALGAELIAQTLDAAATGDLNETPQPSEGITYAAKIDKAEASIDWHADAMSVLRQVRAFNPWPIAQTRMDGAQLRVWDAELAPDPPHSVDAAPGSVLDVSSDGVDVACGRGALRILRLQMAGRKPLAAREFIKAQRLAGVRFARA